MPQETMYRQCVLEKHEGGARLERVIWGPEKYAVQGKTVKVEEHDGSWTAGWTVKAVFGKPVTGRAAKHQSRDHARQRQASDI